MIEIIQDFSVVDGLRNCEEYEILFYETGKMKVDVV